MRTFTLVFTLASIVLARGGEIADLHLKSSRNKPIDFEKSRSHEEVESTNHGITEIGIERTPCFGTCPAYSFIVKSDGTFRYKGTQFAKRQGEFKGVIRTHAFHRLAGFIKDSNYMELDDEYSRLITDNPTTYTTVVMNGKRKTIKNYADAGPTRLWAIEQLIDSLMENAQWDGDQTTKKKRK
jgi:hypothetical protein